MCNHCEKINVTYQIKSPNDFKKALRVIKDNLADGTIVDSSYWPEGTIKCCHTPFSQITDKGEYTEDIYIYIILNVQSASSYLSYHVKLITVAVVDGGQ